MKLKLLALSIFLLLVAVGYTTYQKYSSLKSIDSYESCVAAKGSVVQTSYPATCVTRLGTRFTQPINKSKPTISTYSDKHLNLSFDYPSDWSISNNLNENVRSGISNDYDHLYIFTITSKNIIITLSKYKDKFDNSKTLFDWVREVDDNFNPRSGKLEKFSNIKIGNYTALVLSYPGTPDNYVFTDGNEVALASYTTGDPEFLQSFLEILSTFRFTEDSKP